MIRPTVYAIGGCRFRRMYTKGDLLCDLLNVGQLVDRYAVRLIQL